MSNRKLNHSLSLTSPENPIDSVDHRCGFGTCLSPDWLQVLASKKAFMVVFSFLAVVQGMTWAYFTATITTLEKRFKISSQTTGIVMTGNEISQILFSIVFAYYGSKGHRPRWIATGVLFSAISCLVLASPHAFYGAGEDALSLTKEFAHKYDPTYSSDLTQSLSLNGTLLASDDMSASKTSFAGSSRKGLVQTCKASGSMGVGDCEPGDQTIVPLILIFLSQFIMGIGVLLFFSLGGPYLDDNIEKTQSPMLFDSARYGETQGTPIRADHVLELSPDFSRGCDFESCHPFSRCKFGNPTISSHLT